MALKLGKSPLSTIWPADSGRFKGGAIRDWESSQVHLKVIVIVAEGWSFGWRLDGSLEGG
jgi:hypothetical protein